MKNINTTFFIFLAPLIFMSGCSDKKDNTTKTFKTVEFYIQHNNERESRKKECMNMRDTTETISRDCANVEIAIRKTRPIPKLQDKSSLFK